MRVFLLAIVMLGISQTSAAQAAEPKSKMAKLADTNVQGIIVEGSGHWLMEEAPQKVIPLRVQFLTTQNTT